MNKTILIKKCERQIKKQNLFKINRKEIGLIFDILFYSKEKEGEFKNFMRKQNEIIWKFWRTLFWIQRYKIWSFSALRKLKIVYKNQGILGAIIKGTISWKE